MNSRLLLRFGVLIGVVLGLWMCSKEPDVAPQKAQEPLYSVAKARAYYDGASCTTRTMAEPGPLTPGNYSLNWDQAEVSLDSLLSSVDVPIEMQYRYYRYLQSETDSVELVPIYSKLVVVKEHPTLLEGCYIRYMMPARSMISAYPDFDYDALLNSRPKTDFSGVSVYTDLNGWPMCVAYYYEGELLVDAFLFDKTHTLEENIARLSDLLGDLTVARCSQVGTRAQQASPELDGGEIEEVIILPDWQEWLDNELTKLDLQNSYLYDLPQPNIGGGGGIGDCGGGGGSSSGNSSDGDGDDNTSKHNDKIKFEDEETKEIIEPLLDSISQDCMGQTLLAALDGVTIKTGTGRNRHDSENNTIELSPHEEYSYRDYVLMEELIHRYQYQQGYTTKCIEKELEAKVGWINYLIRKGKTIGSSYRGQLGASYAQVESLAWIVGSKLYNVNEDRHLYDQAIYSIKNVGTKYSNYPYLEDDNYRNFSCIFELIQDCPTLFN